VLVAPQGVVLTRPEAGDVTITGEALRASISHVDRISAPHLDRGRQADLPPRPNAKPFQLVSADAMQLHLRAGPDDQGAIFFKADGAKTVFTGLLGRIAQDKTASMILETRLSHVSYLRAATGRRRSSAGARPVARSPCSRARSWPATPRARPSRACCRSIPRAG
jgi:hypothetical protein